MKRRILVVDDDAHTRTLLSDLCEQSGYAVELACDGREALDKADSEPPDLVLLDLMLPHIDGFGVLEKLKTTDRTSDIPVVILTALGDMDGKIRGMELGADDYITKPFKLIELQTRIHSALLVRDYRQKLLAAEEQLAELRAVDPLTGAGTWSQLKASLDAELARSRRYGRPLSVLLLALDDYQGVRYELGREVCDAWMAAMARRVRESLRGADRLFRLEVDEFVMLLPETDLRGARVTAERVGRMIGDLPAEGRSGPRAVRVRLAGASFPDARVQSSEDLLREANRVHVAMRQSTPDAVVFGP